MDFSAIANGQKFRLVGNLPYNISTPILFHVLHWSGLVVDMYFMLQREVVERMAAAPGTRAWGRLSIMCQYHCSVTQLFTVPPEAFTPAPRVQSVVRLLPHAQPPVQIKSMESFRKLVGQSFTMRRKTLRNCMRGLLEVGQIESAGIDPGLRPESLGLEQFAALANLMDRLNIFRRGALKTCCIKSITSCHRSQRTWGSNVNSTLLPMKSPLPIVQTRLSGSSTGIGSSPTAMARLNRYTARAWWGKHHDSNPASRSPIPVGR
jgi:hypothetical protein